MHILLIRFSSLGDIVLQTPILAWLKYHFPNCRITFLTSSEFVPLLEGHLYIDNVLSIERKKGLKDLAQLIKMSKKISSQDRPQIIIDLHNTLRAKVVRLLCYRCPSFAVNKRSFLRFLLVKFKIDKLKDLETHHTRIIEDFKFIFKKEFSKKEILAFNREKTFINNIGLTTVGKSFQKNDPIIEGDYIVISPIASFESKRWPMGLVQELISLILNSPKMKNLKIVIVAGPNDLYCQEIFEKAQLEEKRLINLQGKTTIEQTSIVLSQARVCVTNDTGSSHIAEAFGVPVISIFGPTSESFGFRTHLDSSVSLSASLSCRPCSPTGSKSCYKKVQDCMSSVKPSIVFENLERILEL